MRTRTKTLLGFTTLTFAFSLYAQSIWNGGGDDPDWSDADNWSVAPSDGADLVFGTGFGSGTTLNKDTGLTSVGSLTFNTSLPNGGLTLTGNTITLTGGLLNQNTTAGRDVTINNNIVVSGNQTWSTANNNNSLLFIMGDLSGSGNLTLQGRQSNNANPNTLWLGGNNSAYTGTIITGGSEGFGLLTPSAMTGGNINLDNGNRNLTIVSGAGTYTFGIGSGNGEVNFRSAGTAGLYMTGGGNAFWDPGAGGDYVWGNSGNHVRFNGNRTANTDFSRFIFGNSDSELILTGGNKGMSSGGGGNNAALVEMRFALADDGSARNFNTSTSLMILTRASNGHANSSVTVSGGGMAVSNMNQIFTGNLNLSGGAIILDGVSWSDFVTNRSGGYGTGANQWQVGGSGGFAARGTDVTIDTAGTTTSTFDRNFTLGSSARDTDGSLYANAGVIISQGIELSATENRTWIFRGANQEGNNWTVSNVVNEISGQITGGAATRDLLLRGVGTNNSTTGGTVQFSNAANDFLGTVVIGGASGGGLVAVFTDDGAFGHASNAVRIQDAGNGPDALLMFRDLSGTGKTFQRNFSIQQGDGSSDHSGFGSFSGLSTYQGTVTYTGSRAISVVQVREGELTLGTVGTPATLSNTRTAALIELRKGMDGTLVLQNVNYSGNFRWRLFGGTLVTTQNAGMGNPAGQLRSDGNQFLLSDVLNANNNTNAGVTWRVAGESQTYSDLSGGGFGGNVAIQVDTGLTLRMNLASGAQLTSAEIGPNTAGFSWGLSKIGEGTWEYRTTANSLTTPGRADGYIRVVEGIFDQQGSMGRTGIWVDGGTYLAGNNSQFTGSNRLQVTGGKIGISTDATSDISRSTGFDGSNHIWNLGGSETLILASRDNLDLVFGMTFPTINAGETLLIGRDGSGTGAVQINSGLTVDGTLGGTGTLRLGSTGAGTATVAGLFSPGNSPGLLEIDGNLVLAGTTLMEINGLSRGVSYDATDISGNLTYGGTMDVVLGFNAPANSVFDLFTVLGTPTGEFSSISLSGNHVATLDSGNSFTALDGGGLEWSFDHATGQLTVIPEPGTLLLVGIALGSLLLFRRKR